MNDLRTAAQMALDALDEATTYTSSHTWSPSMTEECKVAAEALRVALAQGEQEPVTFLADATRFKVTLTERDCKITNLPRELGGRWVALVAAENDSHLKLTAQPQREWQGLTDEEVQMFIDARWGDGVNFTHFIRAIERLIRSKNEQA